MHYSCSVLLFWVGNNTCCLFLLAVCVSGGEGHRLTAAAHAAVLEYAPNLQVVETLLRGPLITAISKQMTLEGAHAAEGFLCEVLENVPSSDTMVLTILTILSGEDEGGEEGHETIEYKSQKYWRCVVFFQ